MGHPAELGGRMCQELSSISEPVRGATTVKLRGAFDPKLQILWGVFSVLVLVCSWVWLWSTAHHTSSYGWMVIDLRVMPIALVLGLIAGWKIGVLRLRALQKALPEVEGQLFLSQAQTISKFRDGENAIKLQRTGFIVSFLVWFVLTTFTNGKFLLYGSLLAYVVGQYLTGQTVPFIFIASQISRGDRNHASHPS